MGEYKSNLIGIERARIIGNVCHRWLFNGRQDLCKDLDERVDEAIKQTLLSDAREAARGIAYLASFSEDLASQDNTRERGPEA